ncbi:hypothetical protein LUZ60_016600 [Juncus effusus]|nr:hypothetical protein LUZ60_016600 [Juncus effusus]
MAKNWENHSNLQCFLDCTTPTVRTQNFPKKGVLNSEKPGSNITKWFRLSDLWDQYYEWSAYGAGTDVHLPNGETVVQYYVPYLSALQLYTSPNFIDGNYRKDNYELDEMFKDTRKRLGDLYFEFFEVCSPNARVPLLDKVYELAQNVLGLTSLTSLELSPASWMAVAWYPIYHIPRRCNMKELSACFLTYHTISSAFQDDDFCKKGEMRCCKTKQLNRNSIFTDQDGILTDRKANSISLPPFGLATYKMNGRLWLNQETRDKDTVDFLYLAAESWLKQLGLNHHDFTYFTTRSL